MRGASAENVSYFTNLFRSCSILKSLTKDNEMTFCSCIILTLKKYQCHFLIRISLLVSWPNNILVTDIIEKMTLTFAIQFYISGKKNKIIRSKKA
jgi:hypothetical protein